MKNLEVAVQRSLKELAKKGLMLDEKFHLTPWMDVMPVWNLISKKPFLRSFIAGISLLILVLMTNLSELNLIFFIKSFLLAAGVTVGFYSAHYFCNRSDDIYHHLSRITLLPKDSFQRWFMLRASVIWGKVNLLSVEARTKYKFRDSIKNDKEILIWYLTTHLILYPVFATVLKLPKFSFTAGSISLYLISFFWCYAWFWTIHWVVYGIMFLVKLSRLPVRYFYGIPNSMTVKKIGNTVVRINYASTVHFLLLLLILYFWEVIPREVDRMMNVNPLVIIFLFFGLTVYVAWGVVMGPVVTQIALSRSMMEYARKSLAKYSYHVEDRYNAFMKQPTTQNYNYLQETKRYMNLLNKMPKFGITPGYFITIVFIFLLDIGALIFYLLLSFHSWNNLRDYFTKILIM